MNLGNDHLTVEMKGPVLSCVLNRPDALNAFSDRMIAGLQEAIAEAERNDNVKVVVLSGAGRAFSAGGDVKSMGTATSQQLYDHVGKLNRLILTITELPKPVVAVVHGYAAGAGLNLALACDQLLAAEDSNFVLSFAKVGLVSDGGGHYFLSKLLGPYRAKELLFLAEPLPVDTAAEWGIVNRVVPLANLEEEAMNYAIRLSKGPGRALGMMKKMVNQTETSDLAAILEQERITQTMMAATEDHKEGIQAFKEKRKPNFVGK
ncbi:2-(1,2-epoxy-1,2-dihydrophenyl)acetyl-CoA isomerase [Halobacillus karajensis]|uniref:1,2-epoxyphenylacetyl-CoA isomerase n=1 Tax=Halobacillus karajensis TaxID=195088 RepID=A0A024P579_9BACI|nr:enoyl-CoA hydratase [Halobacillus karajensis]CDQ20496.1 1,2-epoxyphenylacetyl-CoA isomerase [Halobacillus karajensis]CDQ24035.1 1,2-epoxyphenylacetyl-CoA isomerase [Halobacillus karajensis]CDQ27513.1 1,2-epoxyphenylacetyl-CoA isomerase [Halobacillus karajensis]SEH90868.1 2-(1,2-epoxy-1,2-dihydrophenyl)acetyl-CoA isomerase [Halobacillus karajensis]